MDVMAEIAQAVLAAMQGGPPVVTATVVRSETPAVHPGAKVLVRADGTTVGDLGGGALEAAVVQRCLAAIPHHAIETVRFTVEGEVVTDRHTEAAVEVLVEVV